MSTAWLVPQGLLRSAGACEAFGKSVGRLEHNLNGDVALIFGKNLVAEILLEVLADYEYHLAESGVNSVVNRVVHDCLAVGTETVELLEAAIARAHACGQYE